MFNLITGLIPPSQPAQNSEIPGSNSRNIHVLLQPPHQLSNFLSEITYLAHIWTFLTPLTRRYIPWDNKTVPHIPAFRALFGNPPSWNWRNSPAYIPVFRPDRDTTKSHIFKVFNLQAQILKFLSRCWKFNYRPHSTLPAKDRVSKMQHFWTASPPSQGPDCN